eukprot:scaffold7267_cov72-Phaeocystis_antarctica.AAC.1
MAAAPTHPGLPRGPQRAAWRRRRRGGEGARARRRGGWRAGRREAVGTGWRSRRSGWWGRWLEGDAATARYSGRGLPLGTHRLQVRVVEGAAGVVVVVALVVRRAWRAQQARRARRRRAVGVDQRGVARLREAQPGLGRSMVVGDRGERNEEARAHRELRQIQAGELRDEEALQRRTLGRALQRRHDQGRVGVPQHLAESEHTAVGAHTEGEGGASHKAPHAACERHPDRRWNRRTAAAAAAAAAVAAGEQHIHLSRRAERRTEACARSEPAETLARRRRHQRRRQLRRRGDGGGGGGGGARESRLRLVEQPREADLALRAEHEQPARRARQELRTSARHCEGSLTAERRGAPRIRALRRERGTVGVAAADLQHALPAQLRLPARQQAARARSAASAPAEDLTCGAQRERVVPPSAHLHDVALGTEGDHLYGLVAGRARAVAECTQQPAAPGQHVAVTR